MNGWDSPTDLEPNEVLEVRDAFDRVTICKVVDVIADIVGVLPEDTDIVCLLDPAWTNWRRVNPKAIYGVQCADRTCPVGWFEYAVKVPNWRCRECMKR